MLPLRIIVWLSPFLLWLILECSEVLGKITYVIIEEFYQNSFSLKFPSQTKPTAGSAKLKDGITCIFLSLCTQALWSWRRGHMVDSWQSAVCGAFAGAGDYTILRKPKWGESMKMLAVQNSILQEFHIVQMDRASLAICRKKNYLGGGKKQKTC